MTGFVVGAKIIRQEELERQLIAAFKEWVKDDVNGAYMDEQFLTDKWDYPPPATLRKSGELAGNPRNIYDLGDLYRSGKNSFGIRETTSTVEASWHWDATNSSGEEYAWFVHEGEGPYSRAPRPWTDEIAVPYLFYSSDAKRALEANITLKMGR